MNETQIFKLHIIYKPITHHHLRAIVIEMRQNSNMDMTSNTVHVCESLAGTWLGKITFFKHLAKKCGKLVWLTTDDSLNFPIYMVHTDDKMTTYMHTYTGSSVFIIGWLR